MPNIKSAIKRVKIAERNRLSNRTWKTSVRSVKTELLAAASGPQDACQVALNKAYKVIDMAVSKGVLHKNAAARRKSTLAKVANANAAAAGTSTKTSPTKASAAKAGSSKAGTTKASTAKKKK